MTAGTTAPATFDAFDPAHRLDPYPVYERVRETARFCPFAIGDVPVTVVTRYEDLEEILQSEDWVHGYDAGISPFREPTADVPRSFLRMDPPDHTRLRGLVNKAFTPRTISALEPAIHATARRIIEAALDDGRLEVMNGLGAPVASTTIGHLLGVPDDVGTRLRDWALAIARGTDPDNLLSEAEIASRTRATHDFRVYFRELINERRARPTRDVLGILASAEERGDVLREDELLGISSLMLVAGMETSINFIGNSVLALLRHPDQLALLRERPELTASAVEEVLRYDPPTQFTMRTAATRTTVGGHTFSRGDGVMLVSAAAGRDPRVYDEPDRFDITRFHPPKPARRHLGFSVGIHFCLGAPLARIEAAATVGALVQATRSLALDETAGVLAYLPSLIHRGLVSLPITLA
ncbi:Cytochrome [Frankia sp. AiPs1]|uniref:cytochrome P450 n=1 Tax=Frankia sp. AiPa1 TaxID=573492 RepID=UPI00202B14FB|nr:cytochrome P450 [Frankia sp. AiPa1]MCL9758715.1 cytochrome P450 [Frankia sp. AiPa1]